MDLASRPVARLAGATRRYGQQTALDAVDLVVQRGELLALLGPNGAGKTTAIGLLLGLARADAGTVELFGMDPQRIEARRRIGVMLQSAELPPTLRVGELLRLTASYYPAPRRLEETAAMAGIGDLLKRPYAKLSGGQQRSVQFALAVCGRPELLFLDEPTVGLDIDARQKLWAAIRQLIAEGCSVLLTTHYLEEADALADRVVVIDRGKRLAAGSPQTIKETICSKQITCITVLTDDRLLAVDGVVSVRREGLRTILNVSESDAVLPRLFAADPNVREVEVKGAALEEAFLKLTEMTQ